MLFEINQYRLFATIAICQKFDSRHVHNYLQVAAPEIIARRCPLDYYVRDDAQAQAREAALAKCRCQLRG